VLIDNTRHHGLAIGAVAVGAAAVAGLVILNMRPPVVRIPRERYIVEAEYADRALIYETLMAPPVEVIERDYSLDEIRYNVELRDRMPRIDIDTITFDFGSWEVTPDQAQRLQFIADGIQQAIQQNPDEVFLVEGHTDAIGPDEDNLSLSDRRAESVAQVLTAQFGIAPENLTTQGYGEQYLKIPTQEAERRNRRVTIRRITPLLNGPSAQNR
jgi:outer membrane protein OmpA-like peptidoglycan-associated protein